MIFFYIAIVLLIFSFSGFALSFQINGINRAVINTPIEIMESSIPVNREEPYFNKSYLESNVQKYYSKTLRQYTNSYSVIFYYYSSDDFSYCVSNKCSGVDITVYASIMYGITYHRTMFYEIERNR